MLKVFVVTRDMDNKIENIFSMESKALSYVQDVLYPKYLKQRWITHKTILELKRFEKIFETELEMARANNCYEELYLVCVKENAKRSAELSSIPDTYRARYQREEKFTVTVMEVN